MGIGLVNHFAFLACPRGKNPTKQHKKPTKLDSNDAICLIGFAGGNQLPEQCVWYPLSHIALKGPALAPRESPKSAAS